MVSIDITSAPPVEIEIVSPSNDDLTVVMPNATELQVQVPGAQGPPGVAGPAGVDGAVGPAGPAGAAGVTGFPTTLASVSGDGAIQGFTGFYTVIMGTKGSDVGNNYNTTTGVYTVPSTGIYLCIGRYRIQDQSTVHFGFGIHSVNQDGPWFQWQTGSGARYGANYQRLTKFNAGEQLRMFAYVESGNTYFKPAAMDIMRIA